MCGCPPRDGAVCLFPVHPTAHLPCDRPLTVSGALLTHPLMGERGRNLGGLCQEAPVTPHVLFSWHEPEDPDSPVPWLSIHGQTSAARRARPAVGTEAWREGIAGLDGRKINLQASLWRQIGPLPAW